LFKELILEERIMFCPNCKYEYKLGIKKCPECGAELVKKLEEPKPMARKESKFVFLCSTQNFIYADFIKTTLEKNNIPCLIKGIGGPMYPLIPLERPGIYVPEEKYEESKKIKEQLVDNL